MPCLEVLYGGVIVRAFHSAATYSSSSSSYVLYVIKIYIRIILLL